MDFGKNELKILTETLLEVLNLHTKAIQDGVDMRKSAHSRVIDALMKKIESYQQHTPPMLQVSPVSTQSLEVLHGAPNENIPMDQAKVIEGNQPEGARERIQPQIEQQKEDIIPAGTMVKLIPVSDPTATPANMPISVSTDLKDVIKIVKPRPELPQGLEITPDNIDEFAELMGEDSLEEPEITSIKK